MTDEALVLVADSDQEIAAQLSRFLKSEGFGIATAADAAFVLTLALRKSPDAIILGAGLPCGGSLQALRRLRASVHTAAIPVIGLTIEGKDKQALLNAGIESCLDHPVDNDELLGVLRTQLGQEVDVSLAPAELINDPARLGELEQTGLMDSAPDEALDTITAIAAELLNSPVALMSLVDDHRQFFKSQVGLPEPWNERRETPLTHSFCQWVVSSKQELVITDARLHPILCRNGAVSDLGVVAYAGVPLTSQGGETIGAFCAIDTQPHIWSELDVRNLRDLGQIMDAHTALYSQSEDGAGGRISERNWLRITSAAAKGFLGASRLLERYDDNLTIRVRLISVIQRFSQQLSLLGETGVQQVA